MVVLLPGPVRNGSGHVLVTETKKIVSSKLLVVYTDAENGLTHKITWAPHPINNYVFVLDGRSIHPKFFAYRVVPRQTLASIKNVLNSCRSFVTYNGIVTSHSYKERFSVDDHCPRLLQDVAANLYSAIAVHVPNPKAYLIDPFSDRNLLIDDEFASTHAQDSVNRTYNFMHVKLKVKGEYL